jgi:hypothetical protein
MLGPGNSVDVDLKRVMQGEEAKFLLPQWARWSCRELTTIVILVRVDFVKEIAFWEWRGHFCHQR